MPSGILNPDPCTLSPEPSLLVLNHGENVVFAHQQEFFLFNAEGVAGVAGEDDFVARFDLQGAAGAVVEKFAIAHADDRATGRLFAGIVGQHNAAGGRFQGFFTLDDDAIAQLVEASKLAPNDALYPYSLGLTYAELELYENARDAILAAIARDSSVPRFWYNLALTHQKIGDFTEAIEAILRAEQLAPENPDYPYTRATICMEAGKPADAQAAMDRLQKIAPEHPALRRR